jgi:hypothetical protein
VPTWEASACTQVCCVCTMNQRTTQFSCICGLMHALWLVACHMMVLCAKT